MPVVGYIEQRTDLNKNSFVDFDPKSNPFILFCEKYDFFFQESKPVLPFPKCLSLCMTSEKRNQHIQIKVKKY